MPRAPNHQQPQLRRLATLFLTVANVEDEELLALLVTSKALKMCKPLSRGPYDAVHSKDFFDKLMNSFTSREFKTFLR